MLDGCHLFSKKMERYVIRALDILTVNYQVNDLLATSNHIHDSRLVIKHQKF